VTSVSPRRTDTFSSGHGPSTAVIKIIEDNGRAQPSELLQAFATAAATLIYLPASARAATEQRSEEFSPEFPERLVSSCRSCFGGAAADRFQEFSVRSSTLASGSIRTSAIPRGRSLLICCHTSRVPTRWPSLALPSRPCCAGPKIRRYHRRDPGSDLLETCGW